MLPSFRLISATFFLGFLVMFAGLRLATTFHGINQAIPVMAAHAASAATAAGADQGPRRGAATVPVTYDHRFAVSATQSAPAPAAPSPVRDQATPLMMPLVILPLIAEEHAAFEEKSETTAVAALETKPAAAPAPAPIEIPLPEPATVDLTLSPPVNAKDKPSTAAVAAAALSVQAPSLIDIPLPEPVAVDLTFSPAPAGAPIPATPEADVGPKTEATPPKRPETDARAGSASGRDNDPITVAALADEAPAGTVELPVTNIPLPTPKGVASPAAAHRAIRSAAAKAKPRRKAVAKRDDFDSFFHFGGGKAQ